jgi:CHASE2 domain-containing sensor protein
VPVVDLLHLAVIAAALAIGVWSLITLRASMPRGRFAVFGLASAGALFGCAALAGEVGLLPPVAWFFVVLAAMLGVVVAAQRIAHPRPIHS